MASPCSAARRSSGSSLSSAICGRALCAASLICRRPPEYRELGEDGALDELAEEQPLLLAIVDAVFTAEDGQEVVKPEEYGDLPRA